MPSPDAQAFATALQRVPSRSAVILLGACDAGLDLDAFAQLWGVPVWSAAALLVEALDALERALGAPPAALRPTADLAEGARRLTADLARPGTARVPPHGSDLPGQDEGLFALPAPLTPQRQPAPESPPTAPASPRSQRLRALAQVAPEVRRVLAQARDEAEQAPAREVETWLRRLAILGLLAATAWFYARHP